MDILFAREVVAVADADIVGAITFCGHQAQALGLSERQSRGRGAESRAISEADLTIFGLTNHLGVLSVHIQKHIEDAAAVLENAISVYCAACGVHTVPVHLEAKAIHAFGKVGRQGEGGRIEHIAIADGRSRAILAFIVGEGDDVGLGGKGLVVVDEGVKLSIIAIVKIDIAVHPVGSKVEAHGQGIARARRDELVGGINIYGLGRHTDGLRTIT